MSDIYTPTTDEFEEELSGLVSSCTQPPAGEAVPEESFEGLPPRLAALVRGIEPSGLKEVMGGVFTDIGRLLSQVESVRDVVEKGGSLSGVSQVFDALKRSSRYLLTNVETAELRVEGLPDSLVETLDAAGFALRHELRHFFTSEITHAAEAQSVLRVCALLENCFQQLAISLARSFDAGLSGAVLFENYRKRREQSLTLRDELRALLNHIRKAEREFSVLSSLALLNRVRRFRYECMHYLMYRDWEDFERFADALELSLESEREMTVLLHKLSCYVEALLSQVEMRAVLTDE